jgi:hypothetical protein
MLAGLSSRDMEGPLGVSHGTIISDMKAIFKELRDATLRDADKAADLQERRLDRALNAMWQAVLDGNLQAIDRFLRVEERRAKLRGLDAPEKMQLGGIPGGEPIHFFMPVKNDAPDPGPLPEG